MERNKYDFSETVKYLESYSSIEELKELIWESALRLAYAKDEETRPHVVAEAQAAAIAVLDFIATIKVR